MQEAKGARRPSLLLQIAQKGTQLALDPFALLSEAVRVYSPLRRLQSGEFRVIFAVEADVTRISPSGKPGDDEIYEAFERTSKK